MDRLAAVTGRAARMGRMRVWVANDTRQSHTPIRPIFVPSRNHLRAGKLANTFRT
jgi:hypothetical protein